MRGYGIVSATCVVCGSIKVNSDTRYATVNWGGPYQTKFGRLLRDIFTDRAACVAAVDMKLLKKRASLRKQLAELEALTGEAVVAAAEAKEGSAA